MNTSLPVNGVFVPLDGVPGCGGHVAAAAVGGLGVLVWRVGGGGGGGQVNGLQGTCSCSGVRVVVGRVSIHPPHHLQPVVGELFILKHR